VIWVQPADAQLCLWYQADKMAVVDGMEMLPLTVAEARTRSAVLLVELCACVSVDVELCCCAVAVVFEMQTAPVVFIPCITEHCVTTVSAVPTVSTVQVYVSSLMIDSVISLGFFLSFVWVFLRPVSLFTV